MEWYPVGRILLWIAGFRRADHDGDPADAGHRRRHHHGDAARGLLRVLGPASRRRRDEIEQRIDVALMILPAAAAIVAMMTLTLNFWLAGRITAMSGRLRRPWPDLKSAELPPMTLAALSAAFAFCFSGGLLAMLAQIVTAALLMAYALTGFAVLHTLTLGLKGRGLWLACSLRHGGGVCGWPVLAMARSALPTPSSNFASAFCARRPPPLPAS